MFGFPLFFVGWLQCLRNTRLRTFRCASHIDGEQGGTHVRHSSGQISKAKMGIRDAAADSRHAWSVQESVEA